MADLLRSIIGLVLGICIVIFRKSSSALIERFYNKFPKYKDGVNAFNLRINIRPFFVGAFGVVILFFHI